MPTRLNQPSPTRSWFEVLADAALIREQQIVATADNPAPLVHVSASTWWRWVRSGKAPAPIRLSDGVTVWRVGALRRWLAGLEV